MICRGPTRGVAGSVALTEATLAVLRKLDLLALQTKLASSLAAAPSGNAGAANHRRADTREACAYRTGLLAIPDSPSGNILSSRVLGSPVNILTLHVDNQKSVLISRGAIPLCFV